MANVLIWIGLPIVLGQLPNDPERAIREIEKVGGVVQRDETRPGKPVVSVDLTGCSLGDGILRLMRRFPHLEWLDL